MLVPALMTLDLFMTEDGVKILELQFGKTSGEKGYHDLYGLSIRKEFVVPWVADQESKGWHWQRSLGESMLEQIASPRPDTIIERNFFLEQMLSNKVMQSYLLRDFSDKFPKERIFTYDENWETIRSQIQDAFVDTDEIVIKAAGEAAGRGIIPARVSDLTADFGNNIGWQGDPDTQVLWYQNVFAPAFTVQERVKPIPLEHKGKLYNAPIRLWVAAEVEGENVKLNFFDKHPYYPSPIYYKLPEPIGSASLQDEVISNVHKEDGVAEVPQDVAETIYAELQSFLPQALKQLMTCDYRNSVWNTLSNEKQGERILGLYQLVHGMERHNLNDNSDALFVNKLRAQIRCELMQNKSFRDYLENILVLDPYYEVLLQDEDAKLPSLIAEFSSETWQKVPVKELRKKFEQAGVIFSGRGDECYFSRTKQTHSTRVVACALI